MAQDTNVVSYFKDGEHPRYAHGPKEKKALEDDGWTSDPRAIPVQEYPRVVYNAQGATLKASNKEDEDRLAHEGYSRTPVAAPVPRTTSKVVGPTDPASDGRVNNLEERIDSLEEKLHEILAAVKGTPPKSPTDSKKAHKAS